MSLRARIQRAIRALTEQRAAAYGDYGVGPITAANTVNSRIAENLSTVVACVDAISGAIAALPAYVYSQQGDRERVEVPGHPVARLMRQPNPRQTWVDWVQFTVSQTLLYGNSISVIEYDGRGAVNALVPVPWQNVQCFLTREGALAFDIMRYPFGGPGVQRRLLSGEVFHLRDRSDDGFLGRSRLSRAPEVLEAGIGIQTYSAAIWRNQGTPAAALKHPGQLSPEAKNYLQRTFDQQHVGAHNARRTMILEEGMDYTRLAFSPEDAEVLGSRRFTVEEICRLFGVPPLIVQDYQFGAFTNASQAGRWFGQLTLTPWIRRIEAEFRRSVFTDNDPGVHLEIDLSGLMRGDPEQRWASYKIAVEAGILTPNEVRAAEGFNPMSSAATPGEGSNTAVAGA